MSVSTRRGGCPIRIQQPHKYRSKREVVDEVTFASRMEADFYLYLKTQQAAGKINQIVIQPSFVLQPGFKNMGKHIDQSYTSRILGSCSQTAAAWCMTLKECRPRSGR